jgi:hypothetical protein
VARYGGEEFAVLLPNTESEGALRALNKVKNRCAETRWQSNGSVVSVPTFSAGLALYKPGETSTAFVERVDKALYRAKRLGRNRIEMDITYQTDGESRQAPRRVPSPPDLPVSSPAPQSSHEIAPHTEGCGVFVISRLPSYNAAVKFPSLGRAETSRGHCRTDQSQFSGYRRQECIHHHRFLGALVRSVPQFRAYLRVRVGAACDIVFGKVNTEEEQELAAYFQIRSIPTLMIFRDQIIIFSQPGMLPANAFNDLIGRARELDMDVVRKEIAAQEAGKA